ncbi:hypothetical protein D3227_27490 [Mesorhizobium waimense]|uniref:Uncharacterized protein n=1 Tax=Mesorhizobium waimense TaxID=1300307 RepID=A0A3A5KCF7_9HYPH|nr:hypothetical protein [Mesorhizobium waimense]RJT31961.1 hypothetical protein D3227_27490 [Mesorhizobium waimense]
MDTATAICRRVSFCATLTVAGESFERRLSRKFTLATPRIATMWIPLRIKEAVEIARHRRAIRQIDRAYDIELAKAKTSDDREKAKYGRHMETSLYVDLIEAIKTGRLLRIADSLDVPYEYQSEDSPVWERSQQLHTWHLTTIGYSAIRKAIRQEARDRRESAITWAGVIIGIIGSLTGLLSVWLTARGP